MRIYFLGGFPPRWRPSAGLIFSLLLFFAVLAGLMAVGDVLSLRPTWRADWPKWVLATVLPGPAAAPAVAWSADWNPKELQDPRGWLETQMPVLPASRGGGRALPVLAPAEEEEEEVEPLPPPQEESAPPPAPPPAAREAQVFVYTTHNAESYVPDYGAAKVPGQQGGVTRVAAALVAALEEEGVPAVLSPSLHDFPDFARSYYRSETTVKRALAQYPELRLVVDVHRDAGRRQPDTTLIAGQKVAQILLVVGTDRRLPHPRWQENLAFAQKLAAKMEELYPGLCRGVRPQEGRYNQHLHP
ncbi:MAG: stage II sporulation protein P, partial [Clostridia bacterium]|nr:stage II sporulation protein P [Clostridia bacterium]